MHTKCRIRETFNQGELCCNAKKNRKNRRQDILLHYPFLGGKTVLPYQEGHWVACMMWETRSMNKKYDLKYYVYWNLHNYIYSFLFLDLIWSIGGWVRVRKKIAFSDFFGILKIFKHSFILVLLYFFLSFRFDLMTTKCQGCGVFFISRGRTSVQ